MTHSIQPMTRIPTSYLLFTLLVVFWCALLLGAPLLRTGPALMTSVSDVLYDGFGHICHQIDQRSFHLAGHKMGVCARCASLYFGFCLSLLVIPVVSTRLSQKTPHTLFLAVPALLMASDVMLTLFGVHESTMVTRTLSGGLLGMTLPWFIIPPLIESLEALRRRTHMRRSHYPSGD